MESWVYITYPPLQITILAPTDEALSSSGIHASFQSLLNNYATSQDQIKKLVNAHIVKGVYYADNLTAVAHQHGHGNLVTNENNNKLELTPVNGSVQGKLHDGYTADIQ